MNDSPSPSPARPENSTSVPAPVAGSPPVHVVLHSARPGGRRLLAAIGWLGFLICLLLLLRQWSAHRDYFDQTKGITERFHSGEAYGREKVAIIAVRGVILEGDGFVKQQIDRVREDPHVKAVVLRVDSPGGTVTGSDYIYHHLNRLRKERDIPLVVSMGSIAASGGYYVSMAVGDEPGTIFAEPTTTTGSIGVIVPHYDLSGLLARFDIQDDSVMSHPRKRMLSMTRPMSEEDRAIIQQYVDDSFNRFKTIVKSGRPHLREANGDPQLLAPTTGENLATGQIFPAPRALEHGLVDRIGFIEDAIDRAVELARLDPDRVRVVEYERPVSLASLMGAAEASGPPELRAVLELGTPRAFYLATSLPLLLRNEQSTER